MNNSYMDIVATVILGDLLGGCPNDLPDPRTVKWLRGLPHTGPVRGIQTASPSDVPLGTQRVFAWLLCRSALIGDVGEHKGVSHSNQLDMGSL